MHTTGTTGVMTSPVGSHMKNNCDFNTSRKRKKDDAAIEELPPLLSNCSTSALANYLLFHRFEENVIDTTTFLLECISTLPNAEEISKQLSSKYEDEKIEENGLKRKLPNDENTVTISCIQPRGKMNVSFWDKKFQLSSLNQKTMLEINSGQVEHILNFPNPQQCKVQHLKKKTDKDKQSITSRNSNRVESLLLIVLKCGATASENCQNKKKPLSQICLTVPPNYDWICKEICNSTSFPYEKVVQIFPPSQKLLAKEHNIFWSDNTINNNNQNNIISLPFVPCYLNVNDGVLFPLLQGLLFHKPPMFIPKDKLKSIACGRGGGSSNTRFVDMKVELHNNHNVKQAKNNLLEFTNIPREELTVLNKYIHHKLIPSMMNDDSNQNSVDDDIEDNASHSSLCTHNSEGNNLLPTKQKRSKRSSAKEARKMTRAQLNNVPESDDEDDDDDELDYELNSTSYNDESSDESLVSDNTSTESEDDSSD